MIEHYIADTVIQLLADKACYWPLNKTLMIADTHFGKAAIFRREGIPLTDGHNDRDLQRISKLIELTGAERLIILGDFFHGRLRSEDIFFSDFKRWQYDHQQLTIDVVIGNHDKYCDTNAINVNWHSEIIESPFMLRHEPQRDENQYVLAGHIHPSYVVKTKADRLRLPAFWFTEHYGVLPSFGSFTGGFNISSTERKDAIYVVNEGGIARVK